MQELKTLEDLKVHLDIQYKNSWKDSEIDYILKKCNETLIMFVLSNDEYEYVMPIKLALEDQSNKKTLINTKKALEILLKRK